MDQLSIHGLTLQARIGTHQWEQAIRQKLLVDICIPLDLSACGDQLEKTIDYAAVCSSVISFVEQHAFLLIERVANEIASLLKEKFQLQAIEVTVHKPHAIAQAKDISVKIYR
ncbi:MAG: dihydroneopterin aldolase [Legionellaceae bacterium]|nr:dihydroneopterin aldolase [Legionellaceae bacterium]